MVSASRILREWCRGLRVESDGSCETAGAGIILRVRCAMPSAETHYAASKAVVGRLYSGPIQVSTADCPRASHAIFKAEILCRLKYFVG
eukprot:835692-Rhodomonas_salina.2